MPAKGVCIIPSGITVIYRIVNSLDYYVFLQPNSKLILTSKIANSNIVVNYNIWGPGNLEIQANVTVNASLEAPDKAALAGLPNYTYTKDIIEDL